jgi:hypothetical protein
MTRRTVPPPRVMTIAMALLTYAGDTCAVTTSLDELTTSTGMAKRTVQLALEELVSIHAVRITRDLRGAYEVELYRKHHVWTLAEIVAGALS